MTYYTSKDTDRFWTKVSKSDSDQCWLWTAGLKRGYGRIKVKGKDELAHRFSWKLHFGDIQNNLWVLHHCDNPLCCNPAHLFLGTNQDNVDDRESKHRNQPSRGEEHYNHRLSTKDVLEICEKYRKGVVTHQSLANEHGVSRSLITQILLGKRWRHLFD